MCKYIFMSFLICWTSVSQGTAIRDRIQESLRGQQVSGFLANGHESDDEEYYYDTEEDYYDDEEYYDSDEKWLRCTLSSLVVASSAVCFILGLV